MVSVTRILIVDDDESARTMLGAILARAGHETYFATGGAEALREYGVQAIEVVITDLQMPKVDGLELIAVLRDLYTRPAIIAISGTGLLDFAKSAGADATLSKPVDPAELLKAVARAAAREA